MRAKQKVHEAIVFVKMSITQGACPAAALKQWVGPPPEPPAESYIQLQFDLGRSGTLMNLIRSCQCRDCVEGRAAAQVWKGFAARDDSRARAYTQAVEGGVTVTSGPPEDLLERIEDLELRFHRHRITFWAFAVVVGFKAYLELAPW